MSKLLLFALTLLVWSGATGCQQNQPLDEAASSTATPAVSAGPAPEARSPGDLEPVAKIGELILTAGELDDYIMEGLFTAQSANRNPVKLYDMRSKAISRYIEHRIVVEAANAEGLTVQEFLDKSVTAESEIPDEEVAAYFEENRAQMGDATFEEMEQRIRGHIRTELASEFVLNLKNAANPIVLIEPVRADVAPTGPSLGPDDAPITIVEFSDFQCPYCKRVVPTMHQVAEKYPDQVRIIFRHLPLDRIHGRARPAAEASACADKQGKFWEYHDVLFENNRALSDEDLAKYAAEVELDLDAFNTCVADGEFQSLVKTDSDAAAAMGIRGTPAFFINGIQLRGAKPVEEFVRIIEGELALQRQATPSS